MNDKVHIVYVGPKKCKRDTICGTRTVFPRYEPVPVAVDVAYRLTEYASVWKYAHEIEEFMGALEQQQHRKEQEEKEALERAAQEAFESSFVVCLHDEEFDLAKYSEAQLKTLVEAEELAVESKRQGETVGDYRLRVRDAIRAFIANEDNAEQE
ncbi:hypothetical protein ACPV3P_05305 [Photobacterium damselae]|uniref:hypothetical protein n=1 Tax=Photobacterium damselae TaxID=38293 RepID=UPI004067C621